MPSRIVRQSKGYLENKAWVERLVRKGYTVADENNSTDRPDGIYYGEIERRILKEKKSREEYFAVKAWVCSCGSSRLRVFLGRKA